ncbi:Hypothetical predicted protein [Octopus vulgaris]|uniref:Uncharacterized protein n=1 Tax=Octopus vulgaris TaxID=6645 RepID=A0AA36F3X6_OCTVU|nr:Hypothetical predicted protein [Octopus vulgaris]
MYHSNVSLNIGDVPDTVFPIRGLINWYCLRTFHIRLQDTFLTTRLHSANIQSNDNTTFDISTRQLVTKRNEEYPRIKKSSFIHRLRLMTNSRSLLDRSLLSTGKVPLLLVSTTNMTTAGICTVRKFADEKRIFIESVRVTVHSYFSALRFQDKTAPTGESQKSDDALQLNIVKNKVLQKRM